MVVRGKVLAGAAVQAVQNEMDSSLKEEDPVTNADQQEQETSDLASQIDAALQTQRWSTAAQIIEHVQGLIGSKPKTKRTPAIIKAINKRLSKSSDGILVCKAVPEHEPLYALRKTLACEQCGIASGTGDQLVVCDDPECRTAWHPCCLPDEFKESLDKPWRCPCCTEMGRPISEDVELPAVPQPTKTAFPGPAAGTLLSSILQVLGKRADLGGDAAWISYAALVEALEEAGAPFRCSGSASTQSSVRKAVSQHIVSCNRKGIPAKVVIRKENGAEEELALALPDPPCERCGSTADPDQTLLCDLCNKAWHMFCLPEKLDAVPEGEWLCPFCISSREVSSRTRQATSAFFTWQASSQTTLFFVCRGTDPDPYLDMRLVAVGTRIDNHGHLRYWSPASVQGPRLGVVSNQQQVRTWLAEALGAHTKLKAPVLGICRSLLPSRAETELPPEFCATKLPQELSGLLPDDLHTGQRPTEGLDQQLRTPTAAAPADNPSKAKQKTPGKRKGQPASADTPALLSSWEKHKARRNSAGDSAPVRASRQKDATCPAELPQEPVGRITRRSLDGSRKIASSMELSASKTGKVGNSSIRPTRSSSRSKQQGHSAIDILRVPNLAQDVYKGWIEELSWEDCLQLLKEAKTLPPGVPEMVSDHMHGVFKGSI